MNNKYILYLSFLFLFLLGIGCSDDGKQKLENPSIKVSISTVNLQSNKSKKSVNVTSNGDYDVTVDSKGSSWCKVVKENGRIVISVDDNSEKGARECKVTLNLQGVKEEITVRQLGWAKDILINQKEFAVSYAGEILELKVTANVEYVFDFGGVEWIKEVTPDTRGLHDPVERTHQIHVSTNPTDSKRECKLTIREKDNSGLVKPVEVTFMQSPAGEFSPSKTDHFKTDIKLHVQRATASSQQNGSGDIRFSHDNNKSTIYHSAWNNGGENYFPITLEYFFNNEDMDYIIYFPRTAGNDNGNFKETKVEVLHLDDAGVEKWTTVADYDFGGTKSPTKIVFENRLKKVKQVKFTVKSGSGDRKGFASCSEMEFYRYNPDSFDPSTLFKDKICSELREGVTEEEISKCSDPFYKNIALFMLKDKYPREFRIAEFKAYPHPNVAANECKTNAYSLLDNPTGINVEAGTNLIVFAEGMKGYKVSLRVMNLDKPGGDGFHDVTEYPISEGLNNLKMERTGLAYVMYHTPKFETAPTIKMHFATGNVNGYYDLAKHGEPNEWNRLISNASYKYFDVVREYAHLTFPTERFRKHTGNYGKELIQTYDEIVSREMQFLGLNKYNKVFKNRMYLHVMYHSYMYATWYHTAYHDNTLPGLCHPQSLRKQCWGPAHEIGHCNQTRPAVLWRGMTEVTTNIKSAYIQTSVFNQPCRLQKESMGIYKTRYGKAFTLIMAAKQPHNFFKEDPNNIVNGEQSNETAGGSNPDNPNGEQQQQDNNHSKYCRATPKKSIKAEGGGDVFCKLVPFWQLELYFGKVLGMTPMQQSDQGGFYPELYEMAREYNYQNLPSPAEQQLNFVYIASKAAKANLLDFFEKWGFLTPVHAHIGDYSNDCLNVTAEMIAETRRKVEALNYQKPELAIEFITDNTVDLYKNPQEVVKGTVTRSGRKLTFTNFKNVVVFEVYDTANGQDKVIFISDGRNNSETNVADFTIGHDWKNTYKVRAVSVRGKRVPLDLQ